MDCIEEYPGPRRITFASVGRTPRMLMAVVTVMLGGSPRTVIKQAIIQQLLIEVIPMMKQSACAIVLAAVMSIGTALAAPDFSGVWQVEEAIQELRTVDGKAPPLKPEAAQAYQEHKRKWKTGDLSFDPAARCISPGLPRMLYLPYPFEIIQHPQKLTYLFEWNYWNRHVYLADKAKEVPYPLSLGLSHGRWVGDTLVITTTDLRADNTLLDSMGMPHSESMKITEKVRLVNKNILQTRFTIDDPETFTQPWDTVVRFRRQPKGTDIKEDICLDRTDAGQPAVDWTKKPGA